MVIKCDIFKSAKTELNVEVIDMAIKEKNF